MIKLSKSLCARSPFRPFPNGFTIIELLVCVAILAILGALLIPALSRAKITAEKAICLNNHKQLLLAWMLYSEDNTGMLAPNQTINEYPESLGKTERSANWVAGTLEYETEPRAGHNLRDTTNIANLVGYPFGSLGPYARSPAIYKCPSDKSYVIIEGLKIPRIRSYAMNHYIADWTLLRFRQDLKFTIPAQVSEILAPPPSELFVFIDEHEDGISDGQFLFVPVQEAWQTSWSDLPAHHHNKGTVISFADGHAEIKVWQDARTLKPVRREWFQSAYFPNNQDVLWLQTHVTSIKPWPPL